MAANTECSGQNYRRLADWFVQGGRLTVLMRNQILILAMPPEPTGGEAAGGHCNPPNSLKYH